MKTIGRIILLGLLTGMSVGCEDLKFGNAFLEKPVSDNVSIDTVFSQKKYADQALNQFYKSLPDFMPTEAGMHPGSLLLDTYTDIGYTARSGWVTGDLSADSHRRFFPFRLSHESQEEVMGDPVYGIRKSYIYLENVDKVPDMTADEKRIRKAEAKVVIATHYIQMIRFFGGMPWIDHAYKPDEIFKFSRLTLEETVNKTVDLLDEAAGDLPWYTTADEYGHMTKAAAKALKFRLLLFVASPLFNSETPYYDGTAATERLTWYGDYQQSRWERALEAGLDFLRLNEQNENYYRIHDTGNPQEDYVSGYFVKGNKEVIMPSFRWATYKWYKAFRMDESGYGVPRGSYADMFQWKDGSKFDWNNQEHRAHPFFDENGKPTRDVRLYETLLVNGDKWQGRKSEVYKGGREGYGSGSSVNMKTQYGYGFRKFKRDGSGSSKTNEMLNKPYSCPLIRMPEIYLNMAEIMNHLNMAGQKDEFDRDAYDYLNLVRKRAGMSEVTSTEVPSGTDLLNYLLDERAREFGQEDVRYFDMVRYKKGEEWAARPMEMLETTKNGNNFEYKVSKRDDIIYLWKDHWYLMPFPQSEINKKYGLIQNPGW